MTAAAPSTAPVLFEHFEPGRVMGAITQVYDDQQARRWQAIFGQAPAADGSPCAAEGASMAVVAIMRGYLQIVTPRPPGNVHARQQLALHATPRPGEVMKVQVRCQGKEIRRERRYVELQAQATGAGGRPLFDGLMTLIWAA